MSRLIDADAIRYKDLNADMPNSNIHVWVTFLEWIKRMPTVEERKTGTWTMDGFCTVCGEEAITEWNDCGGELAFTKYCPNCGARMEE